MIEHRKYADYQAYLEHQLGEERRSPTTVDIVMARIDHLFRRLLLGPGVRVLCLGAREGEEVEAFNNLGALARGIDIKPLSPLVEQGDFNKLVETFGPDSFEAIYTNALDHAFNLRLMFEQACGVLVSGGLFIADFFPGAFGDYEAVKIDTVTDVVEVAPDLFEHCEYHGDGELPGIYKVYRNIQLLFRKL